MSRRLVLKATGRTLTVKPAELEGVRELVIEAPELTELPAAITKATELKKIVARDAKLEELPELGTLAKLEWLDVRNNKLRALPASIVKCSKLTTLQIEGNAIKAFPDGIGALAALHRPPILDERALSPWVTYQLERLGATLGEHLDDVTFPAGTTLYYMWEGIRLTVTWEPHGDGKHLGMDDSQFVYLLTGSAANPIVHRVDHGEVGRADLSSGGTFLHAFLAKMKAVVSRTKPDVAAQRQALWDAAHHGYLEEVERLLEAGAKPNVRGEDGSSPLEAACYMQHEEIVARLLKAKADPNAKTARVVNRGRDYYKGSTALTFAVGDANRDDARARIARALLAAGADPNACGPSKMTPMHFNAVHGDKHAAELVAEMKKHKADLGIRASTEFMDKVTPLHIAVRANDRIAMVKALLAAGADPDATDGDGATPLHLAAAFGHADMVKALLAAGASRDAKIPKTRKKLKNLASGDTPLDAAKRADKKDVIRLLED
jgi:ankyrin repeat protein